MSFTSKNLQTKRNSMGFMKGATLFFLGMSCILFIARAFDIGTIAPNAVQYIQKVFLTSDGSNNSLVGITLDGDVGGGITIANLPNTTVLGTNANGKIIASSISAGIGATGPQGNTGPAGAIGPQGPAGATGATGTTGYGFNSFPCNAGDIVKYNGSTRACSPDLQGGGGSGNTYVTNYTNTITGMNFNPTNNVLTLYISGANPVIGTINLSGVSNWNSAYTWTNTTGANINTLATATLSPCTSGQIAKYNGSSWVCSSDLTGTAGGGAELWKLGQNNSIYYNSGEVDIGITGGSITSKLHLIGNSLFEFPGNQTVYTYDANQVGAWSQTGDDAVMNSRCSCDTYFSMSNPNYNTMDCYGASTGVTDYGSVCYDITYYNAQCSDWDNTDPENPVCIGTYTFYIKYYPISKTSTVTNYFTTPYFSNNGYGVQIGVPGYYTNVLSHFDVAGSTHLNILNSNGLATFYSGFTSRGTNTINGNLTVSADLNSTDLIVQNSMRLKPDYNNGYLPVCSIQNRGTMLFRIAQADSKDHVCICMGVGLTYVRRRLDDVTQQCQ